MHRFVVIAGIAAVALGIMAPAARADTSADLSVRTSWIGNGQPRAQVGQVTSYRVTVTNLAPDAANDVRISLGIADQFNPSSPIDCGTGTADGLSGCNLASLDAGSSITVILSAVVCCFPKGESRDASVTGGVTSSTPDPSLGNNFASLTTHITGSYGFFPAS